MMQRKRREHWWDVTVRATDYESFSMLSRVGPRVRGLGVWHREAVKGDCNS